MAAFPQRFGRYRLLECIGRGGMAAVYRAARQDPSGVEREVVVKMLLPRLARSARFVRLFKDEARLSAQLRHDNVVRVHDFGVVGGTPFLELEHLSGCDLERLWRALAAHGRRLPVAATLAIVREVCRGLAYAHAFVDDAGEARPIVHRDVSPGNVMICRDGAVKLLDFGLARLTRGETLTIDTFRGKLAYMSPEQLDRRQLDRRADVFALGALLHELCTGRRLFGAGDDGETVRRVQRLVIDPPSAHNREVPPALDVIVLRALRHDPEQRYPSAAELLAALEGLGGAATRAELVRHLAAAAPELFTTACEACGRRLPFGVECLGCKTQVDPVGVLPPLTARAVTPPPVVRPPPAVTPPPGVTPPSLVPRSPRTSPSPRWLGRRWLLLRLTVSVLRRSAEAWAAQLLYLRAASSLARLAGARRAR